MPLERKRRTIGCRIVRPNDPRRMRCRAVARRGKPIDVERRDATTIQAERYGTTHDARAYDHRVVATFVASHNASGETGHVACPCLGQRFAVHLAMHGA